MNIFIELDNILSVHNNRPIIASRLSRTKRFRGKKSIFASVYKTNSLVSNCRRSFISKMARKGLNIVFASDKSEFAREKYYGGDYEFDGMSFTPGIVYDLDEIGDALGISLGSRPTGIVCSSDKKNIVLFEVYDRTVKSANQILEDSLDEAEEIFDDYYDANDKIYYHAGKGRQTEGSIYANPDIPTYQAIYNAEKNKAKIFVFASVPAIVGVKQKTAKNKWSGKQTSYNGYKKGTLYVYIGQVIPITTRKDFDNEGSRSNGKLQFRYRPSDPDSFSANYNDMLSANEKLTRFFNEEKQHRDEAATQMEESEARRITDEIWSDLADVAYSERVREQNADYDGRTYYPKVEKSGDYVHIDMGQSSKSLTPDSLFQLVMEGKHMPLVRRIKTLSRRR